MTKALNLTKRLRTMKVTHLHLSMPTGLSRGTDDDMMLVTFKYLPKVLCEGVRIKKIKKKVFNFTYSPVMMF